MLFLAISVGHSALKSGTTTGRRWPKPKILIQKMGIETELTFAVDSGDLEKARRLLASGVDPDERNGLGETALGYAAQLISLDMLELLVAHAAKIDARDEQGSTALHLAIHSAIDSTIQNGGGQGDEPVEAIVWLLEHGADPQIKTPQGETALELAVSYRSDLVSKILQDWIASQQLKNSESRIS